MGFSYTRPYDILDTGCGLLAPALSVSRLCGQVDDFTPFVRNWLPEIYTLTFSLGWLGPLGWPDPVPVRTGIAIGFLPLAPRQS